jgi:membrane-associated protease RseP (regulator of RpoE activity)
LPLPADADLGTVRFRPSVPYRKFQDRKWLHALLFLLTLTTTTLVGRLHYLSYAADFGRRNARADILDGLWYSLTILAILGAHEFGHYVMCRRYNVDASLPYFIPLLFPGGVPIQTGTLGAVIRIRQAFPTRQALFDIGVGGPIGGFLVLVPAFFIGLALSNVVVVPKNIPLINLGEPLLFKAGVKLMFGDVPSGSTVNMHPMVFASWFGMLATALNLLPFGQLDGGHLTYATLRRWATPLSLITVGAGLVMTLFTKSWMVFTFMMMVMLIVFGPRHPTVIYEDEPLPTSRYWIAAFALLMLILCISPVPMELIFPNAPAPAAPPR